ncbi:hypothetical protein KSP40_PGU009705 [Platanthera guangdongensis]|uniref:Uncharacterized protein n=1 Tax=Platanthera guangdongensis TaxID=2320717 RepID=A0ABR2N2H2_9ASPA
MPRGPEMVVFTGEGKSREVSEERERERSVTSEKTGMDLLPAETPSLSRRQGFRSLKLVNISMEQPLANEPVGVDFGVLKNGLSYYVRCNPKPRMRAALALAVKVGRRVRVHFASGFYTIECRDFIWAVDEVHGMLHLLHSFKAISVLEEDEERGVAHIVEHLAFSATKKYTNHDIIKFLESIGAEFGACQNASTSSDETIFELLVPVDKPNLLSQAISVLAEFSTEVRVSAKDLEKERGAVLEEYRGGRNASGRMQDSHWMLMFEGSKVACLLISPTSPTAHHPHYAERLPIGLEKVIRNVTPQTVKRFYDKWYHLHNMAVIAVGDFSDSQSVVELIKAHFGQKASISQPPPVIPEFDVPSHKEPRFSCFVESEAAGSAVMISCKIPVDEMKTVKQYRDSLAEAMFHCALNQRFFKISRRKDPPYFSCSSAADVLVHPVKAYIMSSSCREGGTVEALESMLMEVNVNSHLLRSVYNGFQVARVLVHGFSDREISIVRALMMSEIESAFLERDQMQSTSLRDEYLQRRATRPTSFQHRAIRAGGSCNNPAGAGDSTGYPTETGEPIVRSGYTTTVRSSFSPLPGGNNDATATPVTIDPLP